MEKTFIVDSSEGVIYMTKHFGRRQGDIEPNTSASTERRGNGCERKSRGRRLTDYMLTGVVVGSAACFLTNVAHATYGTATLSMGAGGNIYATPAWQVNGTVGTTATYTFTAFGTGSITSATVNLLVVNSSSLGGDGISLTLPTGCKVGSTAVGAVEFISGGTTITANGAISGYANYTDGTAVATQIEFTGVTSAGAVTCTTSGALAYTY